MSEKTDASAQIGAARDLPIVERAWDAAAAKARVFSAAGFGTDTPDFAFARKAFLSYDSGQPELRESYKLPFADIVDGKLTAIAPALRNAAARLGQTQLPAGVRRRARIIITNYLDRLREQRGDGPKLETVRRYDNGRIRDRPHRDPSTGFMLAQASVTRAPAVFEYRTSNGGLRREFRAADHVFSADNKALMSMATVTLGHPPVRVTTKNIKEFSIGHANGKLEIEDDHAWTGLVVQDERGIAALESGTNDTSCGYDCDLLFEPGVFTDSNGKDWPYDAIQVNHRNNHIAILEAGRAGSTRVVMDGADAEQIEDVTMGEDNNKDKKPQDGDGQNSAAWKEFVEDKGVQNMASVEVNGVMLSLPTEQANAIAKQKADNAAALKTAQDRADTLEAERDAAKQVGDEAKTKLETAASDEQIQDRVDARTTLMERAALFLKDEALVEAKKLKDIDVMRQCVVTAKKDAKLGEKPDMYITVAFDLLEEPKDDTVDEAGRRMSGRGDAAPEETALDKRIREAMEKDNLAYKNAQPGSWTIDGQTRSEGTLHG